MPYRPLTHARITQALRRLGELARAEGVTLEVSLYGGAVFTLVYGSRDSTKDVDAIVEPDRIARPLVGRVARELDLPDDWLNDDVRRFVAGKEAKRRLPAAAFGEGVRVSVPTAAYLLSLKLRACRPPLPGYAGDYADIHFLVEKMKIVSVEEAEAIYEDFFPGDALSEVAREVTKEAIRRSAP